MPTDCYTCRHQNQDELVSTSWWVPRCMATEDGKHPPGVGQFMIGSDGSYECVLGKKVFVLSKCPLWELKPPDGAI